jgi:hypothetical protein
LSLFLMNDDNFLFSSSFYEESISILSSEDLITEKL